VIIHQLRAQFGSLVFDNLLDFPVRRGVAVRGLNRGCYEGLQWQSGGHCMAGIACLLDGEKALGLDRFGRQQQEIFWLCLFMFATFLLRLCHRVSPARAAI